MAHPRAVEPEKSCGRCGTEFQRKTFNGRLEDLGVFKRRKYCSLSCANTKDRPSHWETYHWRARKHRKPSCEACGLTERLHVHHVDGNHENSDPTNYQTLCVYCHGFLHATADRLGWIQPGRLPNLREWTDCEASAMPSSRKSRKRSGA